MRLGVLADIHGNDVALRAVLNDADHLQVDRWWALGDLASSLRRIQPSPRLPHVSTSWNAMRQWQRESAGPAVSWIKPA